MGFRKTVTLLGFIVLHNLFLHSQVRVSGFVKDKGTGEVLVGSHIIEQGTHHATISDNNGYFSIIVANNACLEVVYVGYNRLIIKTESITDTIIQVELTSDNLLEEVIVKAPKVLIPNVSSLSIKELQFLPSLGSRPDVLKTIQLLPGIQTTNEGSSLLLVRGGDPGQNQYLIDNTPLIYVNHLGGFTSVFNPDMINNVNVYKGGFPAKYGGKLSSIVDIAQREGSASGLKGSFSIGITDMSFSIEGPIKKKSTFIVTGRTSFLGLFSALLTQVADGNYYTLFYGFHDINAKYSWKPNTKNSVHLNLYQGDDYLHYKMKSSELQEGEKRTTGYIWGNWLLSAKWNTIVSSKLRSANSLSVTRYRLKNSQEFITKTGQGEYNYTKEFLSSIKDFSLFSDWKYNVSRNYSIEFGLHSSYLVNLPNQTTQSNQQQQNAESINALQSSVFVENHFKFLERSSANVGLRLNNYATGNYTAFHLEPRILLNFGLNATHSVNLSFMRVYQYSHLLFTPGSINNNEIWIPSDQTIQPSYADQYTIGWQANLSEGAYSVEFNLYYKNMSNLATYKEGYSTIMGDPNWKSKIETGGKGKSEGLEVFGRKNYGSWTGFLSYTWSHTTREYSNINKENEFLFDFDRPHSFSTGIIHQLNEKWQVNLAWIYQSGIPYTPAVGRQYTSASGYDAYYHSDIYEALIYGARNSGRLKPYHRLDISVNYHTKTDRGNQAVWTFSVYNAYNRQNPYYYYYNTNAGGEMLPPDYSNEYQPLSLYQISFLPILPSVSYKVYFNGDYHRNKKQNPDQQNNFLKWLFYEN